LACIYDWNIKGAGSAAIGITSGNLQQMLPKFSIAFTSNAVLGTILNMFFSLGSIFEAL
jgi:sensor histidine kinase regulating citrate/malate metabolism